MDKLMESKQSKKETKDDWANRVQEVFEDWGCYMSYKKAKLEEQYLEEAKTDFKEASTLFKGICIFVNGYTDPPSDELRRLMMAHGGVFHHYLRTGITTHMIATNLPYSKILMYKKAQNPLPLCKPEWIMDSIKAGRVLDFRKYLLYSQHTKTQPKLLNMFDKAKISNSDKIGTAERTSDIRKGEISVVKKNEVQENTLLINETSGGIGSSSIFNKPQSTMIEDENKPVNGNLKRPNETLDFSSIIYKPQSTMIDEENVGKDKKAKFPEKVIIDTKVKKVTVATSTQKPFLEKLGIDQSDLIGFSSIFEKPQSTMIEQEKKFHEKVLVETKLKRVTVATSTQAPWPEISGIGSSSISEKPQSTMIEEKKIDNKQQPDSTISSTKPAKESILNKPSTTTERNCTKNSAFLTEFYNNSRLHHIATMGAMFKEYINDLRDKSTGDFPGLKRLCLQKQNQVLPKKDQDADSDEDMFDSYESKPGKGSTLMHIDMDCFFVSVGLRNHPELRGFPIAVAHAKGNKVTTTDEELGSMSEIASCSYEARRAGVKNGMFLGQALKLCPNLKTIRYDFEGYKEVSYALYDSVAEYTLQIEAVSCDEMYVDCTELLQKSGLSSMAFAEILRKEIKEKTGCPVSTGFGSNKLQARLATKKAKPDGQFHLKGEHVESYVGTLAVKDLPGVGYQTSAKLGQLGICSCADLQTVSMFNLQKEFGKKTGELLYNMCRGKDNSKLNIEHIRKSVSAEVNYGIRFESDQDAIRFLEQLSEEVCSRLKKCNAMGRNITLKLMVRAKEAPKEAPKFMGHGLCDHLTKTKNLMTAVFDVSIIRKEVLSLWYQMQQLPEDIRGIGIQISKLEFTKNKTSHSTLLNFINKAKDVPKDPIPSTSTKPIEIITTPSNQSISPVGDFQTVKVSEEVEPKSLSSDSNSQKTDPNSSNRQVQKKADDFFKKTKPSVRRIPSAKVDLPSLQEIDMSVLVELPEDIRNEILNEYKANDDPRPSTSKETRPEIPKLQKPIVNKHLQKVIEAEPPKESLSNLSFSQIDPEFLAALSDEMREEVKMYCQVKKKEKESKSKKPVAAQNWNMFQRDSKTKVTRKRKVDKEESNKLAYEEVPKRAKVTVNNKIDHRQQVVKKNEDNGKKVETVIKFDNEKFGIDNRKVEENRQVLTTLINCMLKLPVQQVKEQIQAWVLHSESINEVDLLSIVTYLGMLPQKRRIEDLHVLLKTLHRCVTKLGNCVWHETYKKIAEHIQHNMQLEYNSDLMLPPMGCNRCTR